MGRLTIAMTCLAHQFHFTGDRAGLKAYSESQTQGSLQAKVSYCASGGDVLVQF